MIKGHVTGSPTIIVVTLGMENEIHSYNLNLKSTIYLKLDNNKPEASLGKAATPKIEMAQLGGNED